MKLVFKKSLPGLWLLLGFGLANPAQATQSLQALASVQTATQMPQIRLEIIQEEPPRFEIILNIPATQLTVYDRGVPVRHHKVAVGTPRWPTPTGKFSIDEIQWNPWWLPPKSDWAKSAEKTPPGPGNPLYPVKLMMEKALRIHGTRSTWSIGRAASHGCMRMYRDEARDLAEFFEAQLKPDHKPEDFEEYRRKAWQPYSTKLPKENNIWVYMVYQPLERWSNQLVLHPNYYGQRIPYEEKILDLILDAGVYTAPIDIGKFHAIRKKSRGTTLIPFQDLLYESVDPANLPEAFSSMCLVEKSKQLEQARHHYNTRMVSTLLPPKQPSANRISTR